MRELLSVIGVVGLATAAAAAPPPGVTNAKIETRSGAAGLAAVVKAELAVLRGPAWLGWSVPTTDRGSSCCWSGDDSGGASCRGCRLEGERRFDVVGRSDEAVKLEGSDRLRVLLRAEGGRVSKIRAFSEDCPLDAGGLPLVWIEDVRPADSVAQLVTFVGQPVSDARSGKRLDDGALAAIASHADASADAALERYVAPEQPLELRKKAAFWMGVSRGARGYEVLRRLVKDDRRRALPRARRLRAYAEPRAEGDRRDHRGRAPRPGRARARPGSLLAGPERRPARARGDQGRASTTTPRSR